MKSLISMIFLVVSFAVSTAPAVHAAASSPETVSGTTIIDAATAKALFDRGVPFVDVRKDSDWDAGRIPGAEHLELKKVFGEEKLAEIAGKDQEVVIYCNGPKCMRSSEACAKAVSWGFKKVYYFRGGFPEWAAMDYSIE